MHIVPIYDPTGVQVNQLEINDEITHVNGRVSKGSSHYYKGVGMKYKFHYRSLPLNQDEYEIIYKSDVFYMGYGVRKVSFIGKDGIFQETYQPQFEDFIGTCGVKEVSIIEHSMGFDKSSVEVIKSENYDTVNKQYYFVLNYKCGRRNYQQGGYPKKLKKLLEYMISENWNFIWDKNSITDITYNGLVSDVADIYQSSELKSKLGTIYSLLYSLAKGSERDYREFLKVCGLKHDNGMSYVLNSVLLLKKLGVDISLLQPYNNDVEDYKHTIINYLLEGKNCGHCSFLGLGDKIKEQYIINITKSFEGK